MKQPIQIILILCCAMLCSCNEQTEQIQLEPEKNEVNYTFDTRADGFPKTGDTFTLMSYEKDVDIMSSAHYYRKGYYAYDAGKSTLVPVKPKDSWPYTYYSPEGIVHNLMYGQRLAQGDYYTSILYPAVQVLDTHKENLGLLAVFNRQYHSKVNDAYGDVIEGAKIYASNPMDKNMDGTFDDPFILSVSKNLAVYPIDAGVKMYPITAALKVCFYSSIGVEFTINDNDLSKYPVLKNVGTNGWFNPYQRVTYINYGEASPFNDEYVTLEDGTTTESLTHGYAYSWREGTTNDKVPAGDFNIEYVIDDEPVYAAKYKTGNDSPASIPTQIKLLTLEFTVKNVKNSKSTEVSIPIQLDMESGKRYSLYMDVKENVLETTWTVNWQTNPTGDWGTGSDDSEQIGGGTLGSFRLDISSSEDWDSGNTDENESIGG